MIAREAYNVNSFPFYSLCTYFGGKTKNPLQAEPECPVVGRLLLVKTGAANEAAGINRWNLPFRKGLWSQG